MSAMDEERLEESDAEQDDGVNPCKGKPIIRFPVKLWNIVNYDRMNCVTWNESGDAIALDHNRFEAFYLGQTQTYFQTKKMVSFVRQLNLYGFRKVKGLKTHNKSIRLYRHRFFQRGRPELLHKLTRKSVGDLSIFHRSGQPKSRGKSASSAAAKALLSESGAEDSLDFGADGSSSVEQSTMVSSTTNNISELQQYGPMAMQLYPQTQYFPSPQMMHSGVMYQGVDPSYPSTYYADSRMGYVQCSFETKAIMQWPPSQPQMASTSARSNPYLPPLFQCVSQIGHPLWCPTFYGPPLGQWGSPTIQSTQSCYVPLGAFYDGLPTPSYTPHSLDGLPQADNFYQSSLIFQEEPDAPCLYDFGSFPPPDGVLPQQQADLVPTPSDTPLGMQESGIEKRNTLERCSTGLSQIAFADVDDDTALLSSGSDSTLPHFHELVPFGLSTYDHAGSGSACVQLHDCCSLGCTSDFDTDMTFSIGELLGEGGRKVASEPPSTACVKTECCLRAVASANVFSMLGFSPIKPAPVSPATLAAQVAYPKPMYPSVAANQ